MDIVHPIKKDIQLTDGRILLRPYRLTDTEPLYEAVRESVVELEAWMPWCDASYSRLQSESWLKCCDKAWAEGTAYEFAIMDSKTNGFLGACGLNQINKGDKIANLGYWVRTSKNMQGIATSAVKLLVQLGFHEIGLNRVEIIAATGNKASQRVAEKAGATREGILRNRITINDRVLDAAMFSLIPQDFPN